ncbi:Protein BTR1 (Binding to ToMV RNA 1) [Durusdinium trenchii]|uniref:Protein BTR1 (Binding to ToMV RNA 1) n=1 Tax=Durusdinium trenchii TaxID=1381693 RepID=A0ABP0NH71_9DINO
MGRPQDFTTRPPMAVYGVPGEADLVKRICDMLSFKPLEVNNLSSKFAHVFNQVVRNHEETPFVADKKNDGSFKKWLQACGFEVGPLFERNKSLVYLPVRAKPLERAKGINQERRYVYRGKHGNRGVGVGAKIAEELASTLVEEECRIRKERWEVKQTEMTDTKNKDPDQILQACSMEQPGHVEPEPEDVAKEHEDQEKDDCDEEQSEQTLSDEDKDLDLDSSAAWVEVHPAFAAIEEELDDFIVVPEIDCAWEEVPVDPRFLSEARAVFRGKAVDFVTYNNHEILTDLSNKTGAMIDVSGDRDTPKRLSDRIITISGQANQKEGACLGIVEKLRKLQDLLDSEVGFFVIIVPATAIPVIVGIKGATIAEVLAGTGVEVSIGKENVMGMPDTPIGLEGTASQVTTAVANIHKVIQDMADRGRLLPADFKYRPDKAAAQLAAGAGAHLPEVHLPPADHDLFYGMDPTQNFRTKAKIVVDTGLAGWLIGKGGRTIREMQENSGAFLHVIREDEPTPLLSPGERLIEVCGRLERKLEGIQVVLRTADSMPGNAPKDTRIIVPEVLADPLIMDQVASAYNSCVVERLPGAADGEAMLLVAGSISSRIQAVQEFMSKTDRAHMEGIAVAKSVDGEVVGKDGRPRREIREGLGYAPSNPPPPREPAPWLLRDQLRS